MRVLLLFFWMGLFGITHAQKYPILHYTTQDGLSQMQIMSTFRDSRGYLWVGTNYGFCKFNGERFERFIPDFKAVGRAVSNFAEDSKGIMYIESEQMGRFNGQQFVEIKKAQVAYNELCIDDHDRVFCRSNATGQLNILVNDSLIVVQWPSLKNRKLKWLTYDKPTRSLIGNIDSVGLMRLTPQRLNRVAKLPIPSKPIINDIWLRSRNGQAVIHRQFQTSGEQFFTEFGAKGWQPFLQISNDKCEVIRPVPFDWLFRFQSQTFLLEANTKRLLSVFPHEFNHNTLSYTAYGTWIGTEKGLVFVVQNGIRYFPDSEVPGPWSVVEDAQKRMWFLNYSKPIQRFDGQKIETVTGYAEEMIRQQRAAKVANIIPNQDGWYFAALRDKRGNLWLPNANGVLWHDSKRFDFLVRPSPSANPASLAFCLLEDPNRNVVLQGGEGIVHIFENQPPFRTTSLSEKEGLNIKSYVFSMALERSGVYWFGGGRMLARYDAVRKEWTEYSLLNKKLNARGVVDLEFDNRGTLWAATVTHGLTYLDARRDTVRTMEAPELREPVSSVMQLDNDHLLIGSLRNLYVMDLKAWYDSKKVVLKCFNHHNGFMGIEPGQNGLYKDSRGQIWVMAGAALSVIDPKKIDLRAGQLRTYTTKLNGQRLPFAQLAKDSALWYGRCARGV